MGFLVGQDPDPRCVDPPLGGEWNAATSDRIRAQFLASELAFAPSAFEDLRAYMDRFVGEWEAVRQETCALEPSHAREQALACLRRKELSILGLLEVYREPDPILIEHASASFDMLQPPANCVEDSPKPRPALEPNADLERAHVFFVLGRNERAHKALARAERMVQDPRQRAEVMSLRCVLAGDEGRDGLEICTSAWGAAERAGLNRMAARMLLLVAQHREEVGHDGAWQAVTIAEAKIASMNSATSLRLRAAAVHAELLARKEPEQAVALLRTNIEAKEVFYGASTTRTVHDRVMLAFLLEDLGRFDEARATYEVTHARVTQRLGPRHPHIAAILNNRAILELMVGRYEEARVLFTKALELKLATPGWNTTRTASTHANLARLYDLLGEPEKAEFHARSGVVAGGESPTPYVSAALVRVLRHAGQDAEARTVARAARDAAASPLDDDLAVELALAELATGGAEGAREILLELIGRFDDEPWPGGTEAITFAALAQVEASLDHVDAAVDAAERAAAAYAASPVRPAEWAHACVDMADALRILAPQRAAQFRSRAQAIVAKYAPDRAP
ncbi:MAG: tetratricopeptide repeat protein [Nannocystaceae bacterium]|nr:tetratricopeptide repeat protein [Nannocystaceae bacterium]